MRPRASHRAPCTLHRTVHPAPHCAPCITPCIALCTLHHTVHRTVHVYLVDLPSCMHAYTTSTTQALAEQFSLRFFETSAKNSINVEEAFYAIARDIKRRLMDGAARGSRSRRPGRPDCPGRPVRPAGLPRLACAGRAQWARGCSTRSSGTPQALETARGTAVRPAQRQRFCGVRQQAPRPAPRARVSSWAAKGRSARAEEAAARRTLYYGGVFALRGRRQCLGGVGCLACLSRNIKKAQPGAVLVNSTEWRVLLVHCVLLVLLSQGSLRNKKRIKKSLSNKFLRRPRDRPTPLSPAPAWFCYSCMRCQFYE